ncbi:MAG: hypothetical protein IPP35_11275 [Elusimicrobia bacterium]|nr:hypothetical protein [Elusimicrobiota bacterium]
MNNGSPTDPAATSAEDVHAYQREELLELLRRLSRENEPLIVHGNERLTSDDAVRILQKIRHGFGFSRRERTALTDAGFDLDSVFPRM